MPFGETTSPEVERVAREIVDAGFKIHLKVGPGLLESAYQTLMIYELTKRGLVVATEVAVPVVYEEVRLDAGYRLDLLVNDCIIAEIKAVETSSGARSTAFDLSEAARQTPGDPD